MVTQVADILYVFLQLLNKTSQIFKANYINIAFRIQIHIYEAV